MHDEFGIELLRQGCCIDVKLLEQKILEAREKNLDHFSFIDDKGKEIKVHLNERPQ